MSDDLIEICCPTCGHTWQERYDALQHYREYYRGDKPAQPGRSAGATRTEEYRLRCPNPSHAEYVVITLRVSEE